MVEIEQIRNAFKGLVWIVFGIILWLFASYMNRTYTPYSSTAYMPPEIYGIMYCLYAGGILVILYGILGLGSVFTIRVKNEQ
jgi:hypothetical protein